MVSKRFALAVLILVALNFNALPVSASDDEDSGDFTDMQDPGGDELSSKTDAELIGMERELQAELGREPGNADLLYRLSTVYATLFDRTRKQKGGQSLEWLTRSRDALEKTLMIRPKDKVAHYNLGIVYKRLGQMERAREELKKAIRLSDPEQDAYLICSCWLQIGAVYEEQGFFDEAREAYLQAREYDYGNPEIIAAIQDVDARRKAPDSGSGGSPFGAPSRRGMNPQTAAAMGQDPAAQNQGGIAEAIPALGQVLAQTFGGGGGGEDPGESLQ